MTKVIVGYVDPMTLVTKECPICETVFESPRYQGKKYCSLRCRRKAKNFRETRRYQDLQQSSVIDNKSPFFMSVTNPTVEQLNKFAKLISNEATNDKPIKVSGLIPESWSPPTEIVFAKQQKLNEDAIDEYIMFHPSMIE